MKEEVKYLETVKGIVKENISKLDKVIKLGKETIIKSKKFLYEHRNEIKDTDLTSDMNEEDFKVDLINQYIDKKNKLSNAY